MYDFKVVVLCFLHGYWFEHLNISVFKSVITVFAPTDKIQCYLNISFLDQAECTPLFFCALICIKYRDKEYDIIENKSL